LISSKFFKAVFRVLKVEEEFDNRFDASQLRVAVTQQICAFARGCRFVSASQAVFNRGKFIETSYGTVWN